MHVKPKSHYAHDLIIKNNYNINNTTETTFLGVSITPDLTWKNHILKICNKIKPAIAMLYKLRNTLPAHSLLQIYFSLIHSHISYAILVWGNSPPTHLTNILKLQKKAIRLIANVPPRTSCRPLFKEYRILTVFSLFILESSYYAKKALLRSNANPTNSTIQPIRTVHTHRTRQIHNIFIPHLPSNFMKSNTSLYSSMIYNKLPDHLKKINNCRKFRLETKKFLLNNTIYSPQELQN